MTQQTTLGPTDNLPNLPGYEVIEVIGKGGFGQVYKARDVRMKRTVAAKSLRHSEVSLGALFAEFKSRFEREVVITANLAHPNIVVAYTTLTDTDGNFYLVLEYVSGGTLAQLMFERGTLPLDLAIQITTDICDALEVVWKEGVVHRDIKPNNIFLVKDDKGNVAKAKLADFGVAMTSKETRATTSPTQRGAHPGTPLYMSPEQAEGRPFLDVRSDLYALGLVLYEMVHGQPYRASTTPWADASLPIDSVLKKLLKDNPAERYATPAELKRDLLLIRSGKTLPAEVTRVSAKGSSPWRWLLGVGGLVGIILCLAIGAAALASSGKLPGIFGGQTPTEPTKIAEQNGAANAGAAAQPTLTIVPSETATLELSATPTATFTFTPQPTETYTPSSTPTPSDTATPTEAALPSETSDPSITASFPLPFTDNFTNGLKADWEVVSGEPIITNGRLGTATEEMTIQIGDDSLCDYVLEFDYFGYPDDLLFNFSRNFRYELNASNRYEKWEIFRSNQWSEIAEGPGVGEEGHMQIAKSGATYLLSIDGKAHFDVTYGEPICSPLQLTISKSDDFIDNFSISSD